MNNKTIPLLRNDENNIILTKNAGIGNRIQFMFSCMRIYNIKNFTLYWPTEGWVTKKFSDLFEFKWNYEITEVSTLTKCKSIKEQIPLNRTKHWRLYIDKADGLSRGFSKLYYPAPHGYSIDLEYNRIPESILNIYRPYFERLSPSCRVQSRIDSLTLPENYIALQIRNNPDWEKYGRHTQLSEFYNVIDKYPKNLKIFLSAMNKETSIELNKQYPERILELPNKNYNSMIDATADLFLLSKSKQAIFPYESSFCCLAWYLGGAKADVKIVGLSKLQSFKIFLKKCLKYWM